MRLLNKITLKIIFGITLLLSAACQQNHDKSNDGKIHDKSSEGINKTSPESTEFEQQKKIEPLLDYTGFWVYQNKDYKNILFISSEYKIDVDQIVTTISGVDFLPDFNISTLAFAQKDNPTLVLKKNVAEALMVRTVNGKKELFQINLSLESKKQMVLTTSGLNLITTQLYTKLEDPFLAYQQFNQIQSERVSNFFEQLQNSDIKNQCKSKRAYQQGELEALIENFNNKCLSQILHQNPSYINEMNLIHYAAQYHFSLILKELILLGGDVNKKDQKGHTPLNIICKTGIRGRAVNHNEDHGFITINSDYNQTAKLLLEAGATVTDMDLECLFKTISDPQVLSSALKNIGSFENFRFKREILTTYFMKSYSELIGPQEGLVLLKELIAHLSPELITELSKDSFVGIIALSYLELPALETLIQAGINFNYNYTKSDIMTSVQKNIEEGSQQKFEHPESWRYKSFLNQKLNRMRKNLEYFKSLPNL